MDQKARTALQLDRRLANRRGWIAPQELASELSKLPDSSDKIAEVEEEPAPEPAAPEPPPVPLFRSDPEPPPFE